MLRTMRQVALLVALVLLVAGVTGAGATDGRAGANKYTGCRNTTTGTLDQVKAGPLPMGGACGAAELMVTWNKRGPRGPQGPPGATGAPGAPGVSGYELVHVSTASDSISPKTMSVVCPGGKKVVGGGGYASLDAYTVVSASWPVSDGGWGLKGVEVTPTSQSWSMHGYAICVTALP